MNTNEHMFTGQTLRTYASIRKTTQIYRCQDMHARLQGWYTPESCGHLSFLIYVEMVVQYTGYDTVGMLIVRMVGKTSITTHKRTEARLSNSASSPAKLAASLGDKITWSHAHSPHNTHNSRCPERKNLISILPDRNSARRTDVHMLPTKCAEYMRSMRSLTSRSTSGAFLRRFIFSRGRKLYVCHCQLNRVYQD